MVQEYLHYIEKNMIISALRKVARRTLKMMGLYTSLISFLDFRESKKFAKDLGLILRCNSHFFAICDAIRYREIRLARKHYSYLYEIVHDFDRFFTAVSPESAAPFQIVDFSKPKLHLLLPYGIPMFLSSVVENLASLQEEYCKKYTPKEGDVIFDCGAYCGETTYLFSKMVGPSGKIIAFEPDEENYRLLRMNVELNKLTNVVTIPKGIWSHTTRLHFNEESSLGSAVISNARSRSTNIRTVEVLSLCDAYDSLGLSRLDFIKMDIEGAEIEALSGCRDFLRAHRGLHLSISNHFRDGSNTCETIESILGELGYSIEIGYISSKPGWANLMLWAE